MVTLQPPLPDIEHLQKRLRFSPKDGRIWLDDRRMALIHAHSLSALRREMIDSFGVDSARGLLTRMGYASGQQDADTARSFAGDMTIQDGLLFGPEFHMLQGVVIVEPIRVELDVDRGHYYGEFLWTDSIEVECHLKHYGPSSAPVCWMQIGYAAGYTTAFLGRPILYREVECRGMGSPCCRIVGRPVEDWEDALEDLRFYQSEDFVNRAPRFAPMADGAGSAHDEMVGLSSGFNAATHLVRKVAGTKATVLFLGETGVGKELFARNLHAVSPRASGAFVAVNCAAIPESLLEAELFGVEKGAYTGASASRPGRFERADGGTLFLDEVGTLSYSAQGKLLRALQTGEIERVGDTRTRTVDVRVVAATNEDLEDKIDKGEFRSDLFYRLNVFPVEIPPLRDRRDDLPLLMRYFLTKFTRLHGRRVTGYTESAIRALLDYSYPGNIRELENMVERAVILASDDAPLDVSLFFSSSPSARSRMKARAARANGGAAAPVEETLEGAVKAAVRARRASLDDIERTVMKSAVEEAKGNLSAAARMIGVTRRRLAYHLKTGKHAAADREPG